MRFDIIFSWLLLSIFRFNCNSSNIWWAHTPFRIEWITKISERTASTIWKWNTSWFVGPHCIYSKLVLPWPKNWTVFAARTFEQKSCFKYWLGCCTRYSEVTVCYALLYYVFWCTCIRWRVILLFRHAYIQWHGVLLCMYSGNLCWALPGVESNEMM